MGTRGLFGFHYKGKYYLIYNHSDSYPEALGADLVNQIKQAIKSGLLEEWKNKVLELEDIKGTVPTKKQIKFLETTTLYLGDNTTDWYRLLHDTQGSLQNMLNAKYFESYTNDYSKPRVIDTDIEYYYVLNLDTYELDFYDCNNDCACSFNLDDLPKWGWEEKEEEKEEE